MTRRSWPALVLLLILVGICAMPVRGRICGCDADQCAAYDETASPPALVAAAATGPVRIATAVDVATLDPGGVTTASFVLAFAPKTSPPR